MLDPLVCDYDNLCCFNTATCVHVLASNNNNFIGIITYIKMLCFYSLIECFGIG